ncbi:MAG TPA: DoxX family protein [Saprospiraceae bacterium]|nr:DoxX family protein [Saprospiraceae bacterium]
MKKTKILYWISTVLFAGLMIFSSIPDVMMEPETVKFITRLGYPEYFIFFIGVAKLLGCIAILVPGFPKIREWAYAGLFFDLIGATYSNLMVDGWQSGMVVMLVFFVLGILSYIYNEKYYGGMSAA